MEKTKDMRKSERKQYGLVMRYIHLSDTTQTKRQKEGKEFITDRQEKFRKSQCREEETATGSLYATAEQNSSTLVCD